MRQRYSEFHYSGADPNESSRLQLLSQSDHDGLSQWALRIGFGYIAIAILITAAGLVAQFRSTSKLDQLVIERSEQANSTSLTGTETRTSVQKSDFRMTD
jgi:hypothetical protein